MANPLFDALFAPHRGAHRPFLHLPDATELSYGDFLGQSARLARALTALGAAPGDRVAAQVAKSPEALALYAACVQAGLVFLPLNTAYTAPEVSYFLDDSDARLFVCNPDRAGELGPVAKAAGARIETLGRGGSLSERAAGEGGEVRTVARQANDLAALLYTSGTTGRSKGAMLTHANLLSNARTLADLWRFTAEDVLLHALPIFHTHGLFVATNVILAAGGSMVFLPRLDIDALIDWMPRATALMGVPTFYTRLLSDERFTRELTGGMRLFVSGSAPLLAETHRRFEARTGHRILERYGMTETNMNTSNPHEGERRAGTVGFPLPDVELRVTDAETGAPLPPGEIGQIEVRGPNVFAGYWRMPGKTAEAFRDDGFFVTGDLGLVDADGYVHIVGRGKDLIISGGYNIYPKEIEAVLDAAPGVLESAVVGAPHPDLGEGAVAVLVVDGDGPDLDAVAAQLASQLAAYKRPRRYELVDELPRNTMGKVQKALLRERFAGAFTAPQG